ncbi:hypothetical protein ACHWQZ_G014807 [Mnemiopsis leidyi]
MQLAIIKPSVSVQACSSTENKSCGTNCGTTTEPARQESNINGADHTSSTSVYISSTSCPQDSFSQVCAASCAFARRYVADQHSFLTTVWLQPHSDGRSTKGSCKMGNKVKTKKSSAEVQGQEKIDAGRTRTNNGEDGNATSARLPPGQDWRIWDLNPRPPAWEPRRKPLHHQPIENMSRAFDTFKRDTIINVLKDAGCSEDDIRLVQYLLSNTFLRIRVNSSLSEEFESLLGALQEDSLSGKLFTLILAAALHHLRAVSGRPNPPVSELGFPTEWEYSDDCDFADEDIEKLKAFLPAVKEVLQDWSLQVNESKTEFSTVYLANQSDRDSNGQPLANSEPWRSNKTLGSLLCTEKDIQRRRILADLAFKKFEKVWLKGKRISLERKLRIYDAQVTSVLLYNSNSWSPKKATMDKIDTLNRKTFENHFEHQMAKRYDQ